MNIKLWAENPDPLCFCVSVPVPLVDSMDVYDQTSNSMRVRWDSVTAATGYALLFRPINEPQLEEEVDVRSSRKHSTHMHARGARCCFCAPPHRLSASRWKHETQSGLAGPVANGKN